MQVAITSIKQYIALEYRVMVRSMRIYHIDEGQWVRAFAEKFHKRHATPCMRTNWHPDREGCIGCRYENCGCINGGLK